MKERNKSRKTEEISHKNISPSKKFTMFSEVQRKRKYEESKFK